MDHTIKRTRLLSFGLITAWILLLCGLCALCGPLPAATQTRTIVAGGQVFTLSWDDGTTPPDPDPPSGDGTYVLSTYDGADATGVTDSTTALYAALADAKAWAAANGSATVDLGGSANTWRFHPTFQTDKDSKGRSLSYPACIFLVSVDNLTISGTASDNRPSIVLDAAPATPGGDPRDPADFIDDRGEWIHVDDCSGITFANFIVDGQAPPTVAANNWGLQEYGWEFSHKGAVITYGSTGIAFNDVDMSNFRSEFVYAPGDLPYVGTITINGGTYTGCNASMFSCTADLTVQNLTVRQGPQGIENYAYSDMDTVVSGCDVDTSMTVTQSYDSVYLGLQTGVSYTITDNSGGLDMTNVGAANNNVGTSFTATGVTPTSWGTGTLSRTIRGNGIVIFNQRGAGTVTISNTTVANAITGILMTDFAHHWTVSGCTFTDVDSVFGLSNQATSSTSTDWHANAGWRDFAITDLTVNATARSVVSIIQSDGANQKSAYLQGTNDAPTGYYAVTDHTHNGRHLYTKTSGTATISWSGSQWVIADGATTYATSSDDVWAPYLVTTWSNVSETGTPIVTIHSPRDWSINGLTINESGGNNVQAVLTSKVGVEGMTIANADVSAIGNPVKITTGEAPVYYRPRWDTATCTLPYRTDYVAGSPDTYTPLWGKVRFDDNPDTSVIVDTDSYPYLPDGFVVEAVSSNSTTITLNFTGSGGADSISFSNSAADYLYFDAVNQYFTETP